MFHMSIFSILYTVRTTENLGVIDSGLTWK